MLARAFPHFLQRCTFVKVYYNFNCVNMSYSFMLSNVAPIFLCSVSPMDVDSKTKEASTQTDGTNTCDESAPDESIAHDVDAQKFEKEGTQTSSAENVQTLVENVQTSNENVQAPFENVQTSFKKIDCSTQTSPISLFLRNIKNEDQLTCCTGINSFDLFHGLCSAVEKYDNGANCALSIRDRILLSLIKLKLNASFTFLSICFDIDRRTCSRYFWSMIPILRVLLKNFIVCPSREQIKDNLPYSFRPFPTTVFVLDCTEIPVCSPSCIRCRTQTWSQYKKRHTIKVLIGVTPCGMIVYNGPCYGGKASDNFLFTASKLLERCQPGDSIMVDKGFRIEEECKLKGVQLIRPAFKENNEQLGYDDCENSRMVASARVHVERVMER